MNASKYDVTTREGIQARKQYYINQYDEQSSKAEVFPKYNPVMGGRAPSVRDIERKFRANMKRLNDISVALFNEPIWQFEEDTPVDIGKPV